MKNFLLILITCITILFTSCNTNYFDDYEKEETTTIMTRVVQDPLHPIINGENVYEIGFSYFTFIPLNILENGIFIFNIKVVQNGNIIIQMVVILHILYYQVKL